VSGPRPSLVAIYQFFSHEHSRILVHRVFGDEIRACSYTKCRFPCSPPEPFSTSLLNITLAVPFFSPNTSIVRPYGLRHLAPIPATTSASFRRCLVDARANDQLRRIFAHGPGSAFLLRWRARHRHHHSTSLASGVNRAGWRAPSTGAALPPAPCILYGSPKITQQVP
jgi:hypothetical protein